VEELHAMTKTPVFHSPDVIFSVVGISIAVYEVVIFTRSTRSSQMDLEVSALPRPWRRMLGACILSVLALQSIPVCAAELWSAGKGSQILDTCKIDLTKDTVRTFWRDADGVPFGTITRVLTSLNFHGERMVCASNAGIHGKDLVPIGLYVENGKVLRRLNKRKEGFGNFYLQPNGVFWLSDRGASISSTDEVQSRWEQIAPAIKFATQSGPILFLADQINPVFTPGSDNRLVRNAVCLKSNAEIVLAKSRYPINLHDFATVLRDEVGCHDGLYLDGSVSALYPFEGRLIETELGPMIGVVEPKH